MKNQTHNYAAITSILLLGSFLLASGCAEGYFWRTGQYAPWVRKKWEAEELIANSHFTEKKKMNEAVAAVAGGTVESQQQVANQLSATILHDQILLRKLHAIRLITKLDCPKTKDTLAISATDPSPDVRMATVRALQELPGEFAVFQLQEMIANDTDDDVRIAATRALAKFPGKASVRALSVALDDRNPALQISATESLMRVTGQSEYGRDVNAWKQYVAQSLNNGTPASTQPTESNVADLNQNTTRF